MSYPIQDMKPGYRIIDDTETYKGEEREIQDIMVSNYASIGAVVMCPNILRPGIDKQDTAIFRIKWKT
jgi:hypothetical protein